MYFSTRKLSKSTSFQSTSDLTRFKWPSRAYGLDCCQSESQLTERKEGFERDSRSHSFSDSSESDEGRCRGHSQAKYAEKKAAFATAWSRHQNMYGVSGMRELGGPSDVLFDLFANKKRQTVHIDYFLSELHRTGLRDDDPRLKETIGAFMDYKRKNHTSSISSEEFRRCVEMNVVILSRAFGSQLRIADFENFRNEVHEIFEECRGFTGGKNASYIPQLTKMNPDYWGVSICSIDGQRASFGDSLVPFTIQSVSKPLTYGIVATDHGSDLVHKYVGFEPSGRSFNEITLDQKNRPHNPMINSGAIITTALIKPEFSSSDKFDYINEKFKQLAGGIGHVGFNNSVFLSEKSTAWRNFALAYFMQEHNCFPPGTNISDVLDLYFQICSLEVTCESLSMIAATLANGGMCPITGQKLLEPDVVRDTLSICFSCGMYDFSGQFAFEVGLPAKSSVSGAIMLIVPNVCGIACFSPPLDKCGNSVRGVQFADKLGAQFGFHNFALNSRYEEMASNMKNNIVSIMYSAHQGDLSAFRRFSLQGVDLNQKDYDKRTALHIAAAEGHLDLVRFLVERCFVDHNAEDRWGNTALTDAERFERQDVVEYLREAVKISNSNSKGTPSTSDQTPAPELTEPKPTEPPTDQVKPKQEQGQQEV